MADDFGWYPGKPQDDDAASFQALMRKQELAQGGQAGGDQVGLSATPQANTNAQWQNDMLAKGGEQYNQTYGLSNSATPLTWNPNSKAPTYDVSSQAGWDKLQQLAKVADYGSVGTGLKQFDEGYGAGYGNDNERLKNIAGRMGFDLSGYSFDDPGQAERTRKALEAEANNYVTLKALTGGWGGTGDPREAATTLYKNDGGTLRAVNDPTVEHAKEKGSWLDEHGAARVAIYGAALVAAAPYAVAALGAAGAGGAATAGAAEGGLAAGTGAGITGTGGASGMAAYGAGAAPGYLATAGTGSLGAGVGTAGAIGGGSTLAGSLGAYEGAGLFQPGGITAAQAASIGPYQGSSLTDKAKEKLVDKAKSEAIKRGLGLLQGQGAGSGGLSGGTQGGGGGRDLSGLLGNPQLGAAQAQEKAFLRDSYAPVAMDARRRRLKGLLSDDEA